MREIIVHCPTKELWDRVQEKIPLMEEGVYRDWRYHKENSCLCWDGEMCSLKGSFIENHPNIPIISAQEYLGEPKQLTHSEFLAYIKEHGPTNITNMPVEEMFGGGILVGQASYYHQPEDQPINQLIIKKTMNKVIKFIKNATLSADDKLLRENGLKNECRQYSEEYKEIVTYKLYAENEPYVIEKLKATLEAEKEN
jgi:hypothetical protein